ncbi:hypothetical protein BGZ83_004202, partial [Gryganskiella cystojenkinii]
LRARVLFEPNEMSEIEEIRNAMENMRASDPQYAVSKIRLKDLIRSCMQQPERYQAQIDNAAAGELRRKYVLTGDLSTNGYDLRIIAYKLTEGKGSSQLTTSATSNVVASSSSQSGSGPFDINVETASTTGMSVGSQPAPGRTDITPQPSIEMNWNLDPSGNEEQATSESQHTPASTPTTTTTSNTAVPWSTAPCIKGWPYITDRFGTQEQVDLLHENTDGPQIGTRSLCIDPGVACTATATLIHSGYANDNINLSIARGPRDVIDKRYRKEQSKLKVDAGIPEIEARLVPLKPVEVMTLREDPISTETMEKAVQEYQSSVLEHILSRATESSALRAYYGGEKFKKDKYDY